MSRNARSRKAKIRREELFAEVLAVFRRGTGAALLSLGLACGPASGEDTDASTCPPVSETPAVTRADVCAKHPWTPACATGGDPIDGCHQLLTELEDCAITVCDYAACADALAVQTCGEPRPAECDSIVACLN